jgi:hypothetical protein
MLRLATVTAIETNVTWSNQISKPLGAALLAAASLAILLATA